MDDGAYECPIARCEFSGTLGTVANHVEKPEESQHSWTVLGYSNAAEFKRNKREKQVKYTPGEVIIEPCPLTELYEAFQGVRRALLTTIRSDNSSVKEDDLTSYTVQYEKVLASFSGKTQTESGEILGYGTQHTERAEHNVQDYREQHGNVDWIADYRCIEVEPLSQDTRQALSSHDLVESPTLLVKPVTPHSGIPIPELVTTETDLSRALSLLSQFPYQPPTVADQSTTSARFPVKDVYHAILAETDIDPIEINTEQIPSGTRHDSSSVDVSPHWKSSPVASTSPETETEINDFLTRYGKLTHLYRRVIPPEDAVGERPIPIFGLDFYEPITQSGDSSQHTYRILSFAKGEKERFRSYFVNRVRDFIYQRLLKDSVRYNYITVFPGHEAHSISPTLIQTAKEATIETPIVYAELLERIQRANKQSEQDAESRWDVAREPDKTLRVRHQLPDARVVVLDDVSTSGGSLAAAAHLLRRAGATEVIGLTLGVTKSHDYDNIQEINNREARASDIIDKK